MARRFASSKFGLFLFGGVALAFAGSFGSLSDSIILGHVIGEDALAGVNMLASIRAVTMFLACVIAIGTVNNYSIWMGRLDRSRARDFFAQGLWTILAIGGAVSLFMLFGGDWYLSLLEGEEYVTMYAEQYLEWAWPLGLLECLLVFFGLCCCADGDFRLCTLAGILALVLRPWISYVAVEQGMGAAGCALGAVASEGAALLVLGAHAFRKSNTFVPAWHFSLFDTYYIFRASAGDGMMFVCDAVLFFLINRLVIVRYGSDFLPVAGMAIVLWDVFGVFNGIGMAAQPLVSGYWGERNTRGIRRVMRVAMVAATIGGLLFTLKVLFLPGVLTRVFGIEYPDLVVEGRACLNLICLGAVPIALAMLLKSYYLFIERPLISLALALTCFLAMPALATWVGAQISLRAMWLGLGLGPLLGLALMSAAILLKRGRRGFPLILPRKREDRVHMFDLALTTNEIVEVSRAVANLLEGEVRERAALMVEEVLLAVKERNGARAIRGEVTLDLNDGVVLALRDDGEIFDITDADAKVESLRAYLVASVMERQRERVNLVATGFNRNVFRFA